MLGAHLVFSFISIPHTKLISLKKNRKTSDRNLVAWILGEQTLYFVFQFPPMPCQTLSAAANQWAMDWTSLQLCFVELHAYIFKK
jgi:hypothetical protein